jgi:acyl carrier protein
MNDTELRLELKLMMIRELDLADLAPDQIEDDAPLFGGGLGLDSLDALQLAMAIEERFDVSIPEGDEAKPIFASVATIARYISHQQ